MVDLERQAAFGDRANLSYENTETFYFTKSDGTDAFTVDSNTSPNFVGAWKPDSNLSRFNKDTYEMSMYFKRGAEGIAFNLGPKVTVGATVAGESVSETGSAVVDIAEVYFAEERVCADDEVKLTDGTCGCSETREKVNGKCTPKCTDPEVRLADGTCGCSDTMEKVDGTCVDKCEEGVQERI